MRRRTPQHYVATISFDRRRARMACSCGLGFDEPVAEEMEEAYLAHRRSFGLKNGLATLGLKEKGVSGANQP